MGSEIEMKIPLSSAQFDELYKKIFEGGGIDGISILDSSKDLIFKRDEYFSKYKTLEEREKSGEPQVIRLRTEAIGKGGTEGAGEGKKSYFTIKRKTLRDGVEVNKEDETFIEDAEVLREFFTEAGYWCWFNKEKSAYSAHCKINNEEIVFHVELVIVNGMHYIETEVTSQEIEDIQALDGLERFIKKIGLNPADKDGRSWYKIISE